MVTMKRAIQSNENVRGNVWGAGSPRSHVHETPDLGPLLHCTCGKELHVAPAFVDGQRIRPGAKQRDLGRAFVSPCGYIYCSLDCYVRYTED